MCVMWCVYGVRGMWCACVVYVLCMYVCGMVYVWYGVCVWCMCDMVYVWCVCGVGGVGGVCGVGGAYVVCVCAVCGVYVWCVCVWCVYDVWHLYGGV